MPAANANPIIIRWMVLFLLWGSLAGSALAVGNDNFSLENDPEYRQAKALVEAKQWNDALSLLRSLQRDIKDQPDIHNLLGIVHRKLGDYPTSKRHYDRALEIDPDHRPTLEYQGEWFLEKGQIEAARANLVKLRRLCIDCGETRDLEAAFHRHGVTLP
jgi:tetratricopeptide (TPR) repeat protein